MNACGAMRACVHTPEKIEIIYISHAIRDYASERARMLQNMVFITGRLSGHVQSIVKHGLVALVVCTTPIYGLLIHSLSVDAER